MLGKRIKEGYTNRKGLAGALLSVLIVLLFVVGCSDADGKTAVSTPVDHLPAVDGGGSQTEVQEQTASGDTGSQSDTGSESEAAEVGSAETPVAAGSNAGGAEAVTERELIVCMGGAIPDFYLYGEISPAASAVRHVLDATLFTTAGYEYRAQGLKKMPSLADGDARRTIVRVEEGDRVVDTSGRIVDLREGVHVLDGGGLEVVFENEPIWMEQLTVDYEFEPLVWSDGTPVTAADSVFSFSLAADPTSTLYRPRANYTASYVAQGDAGVRWTGLPGYLDRNYASNVWQPLPAHLLDSYTTSELANLDILTREAVSSGPYHLTALADGSTLVFEANPHYYRREEGLPHFDRLTMRFGDAASFTDAASGCDVIAGDAFGAHNYVSLQESGDLEGWDVLKTPGNVYEQVAFGIQPVFEYADRRPDWFGNASVRQAIAMCSDREAMVDAFSGGSGEILNTLTPSSHPLTPADLVEYGYNPEEANALLDAAGYVDFAGDGRRQDVSSGVPMTVTLGTNSESAMRLGVTKMLQENLAQCGIPVTLYDRTAGTWFAPGPSGPVFGRQFDMAQLAWVGHVNPDCTPYMSDQIPGPESAGFDGWNAPNVSGWSNEAYDAACRSATMALPGSADYDDYMREALRIFNEQLPVLPLFTNFEAVAVRPGMVNVEPDAAESSPLWNIAEWERVE